MPGDFRPTECEHVNMYKKEKKEQVRTIGRYRKGMCYDKTEKAQDNGTIVHNPS